MERLDVEMLSAESLAHLPASDPSERCCLKIKHGETSCVLALKSDLSLP